MTDNYKNIFEIDSDLLITYQLLSVAFQDCSRERGEEICYMIVHVTEAAY